MRTMPNCPELPYVRFLNVNGKRWVGIMEGERYGGTYVVESDDAGESVRTFELPGPEVMRLFSSKDRVLLLVDHLADDVFYTSSLVELDAQTGKFSQPAGAAVLGDPSGFAAEDGTFTSVGFKRTPFVTIMKFHPKDNSIETFELPCTVEGCEQPGSPSFKSRNGELFTAISQPTKHPERECSVSVHVNAKTVTSTCAHVAAPAPDTTGPFLVGLGLETQVLRPKDRPFEIYSEFRGTLVKVVMRSDAAAGHDLPIGRDGLCLPDDNHRNDGTPCDRMVTYLQVLDAKSAIVVTRERHFLDDAKRSWRQVFRSRVVDIALEKADLSRIGR